MKNRLIIIGLILFSTNLAMSINITSDFLIQNGDDYSSTQFNVYDTPPDTTTLTMTGGTAYALVPYDSSIVDINGGYADYIVPYDSALVNMSGGDTYNIRSYNTSEVDFSGGSVTYLAAFDSSTVDITGGTISNLSGYDSSVINIYGSDFFVSSTGGLRGDGYITGNWLDGNPFNISIFNNPDYGDDTLGHINLVPEPTTLLLLGMGGVLMRKR